MSREDYEGVVHDPQRFRACLDGLFTQHPELFPAGMAAGYQLYGLERQSRKMPELQVRRICLKALDGDGRVQVFRVMPSCVLPYRAGYTDEVEKALFLRRLGVPFWA
jgi:hypothetical protein